MRKFLQQMLILCLALAVLGLPLAALAEEVLVGWTLIEGVWYYVDEDGQLLDHDPYLFTLPPEDGAYIGGSPSVSTPAQAAQVQEIEEMEEPIAEEPIVQEPAVEEPVAEEPAVEEPMIEEPVAEEPAVEEPMIEEPVAEEPALEEPMIEEPVAEEPALEAPIAQEPVDGEPAVEEPVAEEPIAKEPAVEEPAPEEPAVLPAPEDVLEGDAQLSQVEDIQEMEEPQEVEQPKESGQDELSVSIYVAYSGDQPYYGSTIQLLSLVAGAPEDAQLSYQWQYKDVSGEWQNVPGATSSTYEYVLDETNDDYAWRLVVTP